MADDLPDAGTWNQAVEHSKANPAHILGPYEDNDGRTQIDCSSCDFDTAKLPATARPPRRLR